MTITSLVTKAIVTHACLGLGFAIGFSGSIECSIAPVSRSDSFVDPDPRNDQLTWYEPILADLLMKAVFPGSLPKGDLFFQITNQGPKPLNFVTVEAACYGTRTEYTGGIEREIDWQVQSINLTLAPGETKSYSAGITLDTTTYWYRIACQVQSQDTSDPQPMNNVLVVTIPPPP